MYKAIFYTHLISVKLFLIIYLIKTFLLLTNKNESLIKFVKAVKVPEMIVSALFLITGIYMLTQIPDIKSFMIIKIVLVLASIPLAVIGFKKGKKALAAVAFVLIVAAYGLAEMSKKQKLTVEAPVTTTYAGLEIYTANCAKCHGADGKLGLMDAPDLTASTKNIDEKTEIIKNGKGAMTGYTGLLTDVQIKAVAEYIESLK